MNRDLKNLRQQYQQQEFNEQEAKANPIDQFNTWFDEALNGQILEPNAFTLATVDAGGFPDARVVLLKEISEDGCFVFYTNYQSKKAQDLAANNKASMVFLWLEMERQVRIKGTVSKVPEAQTLAYFSTRPKDSQIGAWASPQSQVIANKSVLIDNFEALKQKFEGGDVPLPSHWGGYQLKPEQIEFWQGRPNRLHDRLQYNRKDDSWDLVRLAP